MTDRELAEIAGALRNAGAALTGLINLVDELHPERDATISTPMLFARAARRACIEADALLRLPS